MSGFQNYAENPAAGRLPLKDSRDLDDGKSKLPTNVADPVRRPRMLEPGNDLVRRALEPQRGSCRPVQNAVVSFGEVQLGTGARLAVTQGKVGGDGGDDANCSTVSLGRLAERVEDRFLPSSKDDQGNGDGARSPRFRQPSM